MTTRSEHIHRVALSRLNQARTIKYGSVWDRPDPQQAQTLIRYHVTAARQINHAALAQRRLEAQS